MARSSYTGAHEARNTVGELVSLLIQNRARIEGPPPSADALPRRSAPSAEPRYSAPRWASSVSPARAGAALPGGVACAYRRAPGGPGRIRNT
jgi:hypothetical protein